MATDVKTGMLSNQDSTIKLNKLNMFDEKHTARLYISNSPSVLTYPMFVYLRNYDFSCTEQLVSRTIPYILMPSDKLIGTNYDKSKQKIEETMQTLINRQNDDGSFGLWALHSTSEENDTDETTAYVTAYTMNFLTMARQAGFNVPQNMFGRGIDFLRTYAGRNATSVNDAKAKAFTIYVLTLNDYVTTSYIETLEEYLNENIKDWSNDLIGSYIAAAYKMLKQTEKANTLFEKYTSNGNGRFIYKSMFDSNVASDAFHNYLGIRYFDKRYEIPGINIENYIKSGNYDSFNSAAIIMSFVGATANRVTDMSGTSIFVNDEKLSTTIDSGVLVSRLSNDATKIYINCPVCNETEQLFYTVVRQGFPKKSVPESNGIEISRKYYDVNGNEITSGNIGDFVDVKINVRTRGTANTVSNAVITDLLPGGFIPVSDSLNGDMEFGEVRDDRVLIYAPLTRTPTKFTYRVQLSTSGKFIVPSITARDMYNPSIDAVGASEYFTVSNATE